MPNPPPQSVPFSSKISDLRDLKILDPWLNTQNHFLLISGKSFQVWLPAHKVLFLQLSDSHSYGLSRLEKDTDKLMNLQNEVQNPPKEGSLKKKASKSLTNIKEKWESSSRELRLHSWPLWICVFEREFKNCPFMSTIFVLFLHHNLDINFSTKWNFKDDLV